MEGDSHGFVGDLQDGEKNKHLNPFNSMFRIPGTNLSDNLPLLADILPANQSFIQPGFPQDTMFSLGIGTSTLFGESKLKL